MRNYLTTHEYLPLIIFTLLWLVLYPYIEQYDSILGYHVMISLILLSGIASIWNSRRLLTLTASIGILAFALSRADFFADSEQFLKLYLRATFIFFLLVLIQVVSSIFRHDKVSNHLIYAAIAWYLMIGMVWSFLFGIIEVTIPWSFQPVVESIGNIPSFLYYSFVSMLTIWYGDIAPVWSVAQMRSVILAIAGQLYLTIILGTLIWKYVREK